MLHEIFGGQRQPFVRFSGVATEWDFVEAPSQLLESWAWDYGTLARFARRGDGQVCESEWALCPCTGAGFILRTKPTLPRARASAGGLLEPGT